MKQETKRKGNFLNGIMTTLENSLPPTSIIYCKLTPMRVPALENITVQWGRQDV